MEVAPPTSVRGMWAHRVGWLARRARRSGAACAAPQPGSRAPALPARCGLLLPGAAALPPPGTLRGIAGWPSLPAAAAAGMAPHSSRRRSVALRAKGGAAAPAAPLPSTPEERITDVELASEASSSYLAYAMSVIVGRALPDVRDGLKPVHRRILYAMHDLGLRPNKPYRKCARVVGEVLGKYHPHGDAAVYDTLVRMAQDFVMGAPLVAGHGNFGSLDADPPAAMRYTECRLQPLADAMLLADLSDATAPWSPTFDGAQREPGVLPARLPNLLLNGATGIAVGMATNIPPHALNEVADALVLLARRPDASLADVMAVLPAPDFPTGGELLGGDGLRAAYATGNGSYTLRGTARIETLAGTGTKSSPPREAVVITEIPHAGNKAVLVKRIAALVNERTIDGVSDIRDESDRDGMRVVIELRRGADAAAVLAALYKHTKLSQKMSINMIALVDGAPRSVGLLEVLRQFITFRCDVIRKRAGAQLAAATERAHIVEGLLTALADMDGTVAAIRGAADAAGAAAALRALSGLSDAQAAAVLAMPLRRLTGLESGKLRDEAAQLAATLADLTDLLRKEERVIGVLVEEALELKAKYGQPRRTRLGNEAAEAAATAAAAAAAAAPGGAESADLECLITLSERGYIKRMRPAEFEGAAGGAQRRNTRGKTAGRLRADDALLRVLSCRDRDTVLLFSERGRAYALPAAAVPEASRTSGGEPLPQLISLAPGEAVTAVITVPGFAPEDSLVMLTAQGVLKRVLLSELSAIRSNGLTALKLGDGDTLRFVRHSKPGDALLVASSDGYVLRFPVDDDNLRVMGRAARGVRCMNVERDGATVISLDVLPGGATPAPPPGAASGDSVESDTGAESGAESDGEAAELVTGKSRRGPWVLLVTQRGLAKRVPVAEFRQLTRAKRGVRGVVLRTFPDGSKDELTTLRVVGLPPPTRLAAARPARRRARAAGADTDSDSEMSDAEDAAAMEEEVVVASVNGVINRCRLSAVTVQGRGSRGTLLMKLDEGDRVRTATILPGAVAAA